MLKEHMKLVAQSYSALSYLVHFCPHTSVTEIIGDVQRDWQPGTKLSDQHFKHCGKSTNSSAELMMRPLRGASA